MGSHDISITGDRLDAFRKMYVADGDLSSRMSDMLWFDMYVLDVEFGINPREVLVSIENLEAGEPSSGIKPATQFRKLPLKGLWHKHYFAARFLAHNLILGLGNNGLEKLINEVMDPAKSDVVTREMVEELAYRVSHEPFEERHRQGKMTGEWIVFAKHNSKNFYLCLTTHETGDQPVFERIMQHCIRDFPDLAAWIAQAQS
ncbi:hypothetical protein [Nitrobacter sp.]|uniref:hypothetical protein n=1 Tax=Nitrobacter sp. TaxID=29420 RepID=UPI00399D5AA8